VMIYMFQTTTAEKTEFAHQIPVRICMDAPTAARTITTTLADAQKLLHI